MLNMKLTYIIAGLAGIVVGYTMSAQLAEYEPWKTVVLKIVTAPS